jgi:hypothetical protein
MISRTNAHQNDLGYIENQMKKKTNVEPILQDENDIYFTDEEKRIIKNIRKKLKTNLITKCNQQKSLKSIQKRRINSHRQLNS